MNSFTARDILFYNTEVFSSLVNFMCIMVARSLTGFWPLLHNLENTVDLSSDITKTSTPQSGSACAFGDSGL